MLLGIGQVYAINKIPHRGDSEGINRAPIEGLEGGGGQMSDTCLGLVICIHADQSFRSLPYFDRTAGPNLSTESHYPPIALSCNPSVLSPSRHGFANIRID